MTEKRRLLLYRFDKFLNSSPRKQLISPQCANIAEDYAEQEVDKKVQEIKQWLIDEDFEGLAERL